jgi:two-component system response regulator (stage 0 sporulation protein A)
MEGITKRLYPAVAKKHGSTASRVERSIRHAIQVAWQKGAGPRFTDMMGYTSFANGWADKPTNSHFIAAVAERYRILYAEI